MELAFRFFCQYHDKNGAQLLVSFKELTQTSLCFCLHLERPWLRHQAKRYYLIQSSQQLDEVGSISQMRTWDIVKSPDQDHMAKEQ